MEMENERGKGFVPAILLTLVQQLNYTAREAEIALQSEENGNKIAKLQGFLAGVLEYKEAMAQSGYALDEKYFSTQECKMPYKNDDFAEGFAKLRDIVSDIDDLTESPIYKSFTDKLALCLEGRKNDLFYNSDKGRDLYFVKGWHKAITKTSDTIDSLHALLDVMEKEKEETLPFGDEE